MERSPNLADQMRTLPAQGAGRDRRLLRLTDLQASALAAAALQAAAARVGDDTGVLASALMSARAVWEADREDHGPQGDDPAARDRLRDAVASPGFLSLLPAWIRELRESASHRPGTGACTLATALELWSWTMYYFRSGEGARAESASRAVDELAEALCPLVAARCLALEVAAEAAAAPSADFPLRTDLCHVNAAHAAAQAGAACAELVFGYRRHLGWDAEGCAACYAGDELDDLEAVMPGIASGARTCADVVEADGSHPAKAGPCARFDGVEGFTKIRRRLDGCLTGARLARDRAAAALAGSLVTAATPPKASPGRT
jgi:hypothetical protein